MPEAHRRRRLLIFGGVVVVAILVVALLIGLDSGGGSSSGTVAVTSAAPKTPSNPSGLKGVSAIQSEFAGIPQTGNVLGNPNAKATLMVFADPQCPFCAEFENGALPSIVRKYVKPGKLKVVFQPIVIIGKDSILGVRAVAAAGQQGKLFQYAATIYHNQGQENSGYMNQSYLKKIGSGVSGLDVNKLVADLKAAPVNKLLNDAQSLATSGHVSATPTFFVATSGQPLQQLQVSGLTGPDFYPQLDKATG